MSKNKEIEEDLVIIGITAYVAKEKIDKCYEAGMTEVLNKPISHDDFNKIMKKYGFWKSGNILWIEYVNLSFSCKFPVSPCELKKNKDF